MFKSVHVSKVAEKQTLFVFHREKCGAFHAVVQVHHAVIVEYERGVRCKVEGADLLEVRGTDAAPVTIWCRIHAKFKWLDGAIILGFGYTYSSVQLRKC